MSAAFTLDALRRCLERNGLLHPEARLAAAVSGGSDSMALLYGLHLLRQESGFSLSVCHVQHGLRGEASLGDEQLVTDTCQRLGIPCTVYTAHLGGDLHAPGMETNARQCRRSFYAEEMSARGAQAMLLAHHLDDQAETLLLHLLRGAGGNGLGGMQKTSLFAGGLLLRPFLGLTKQQLLDALTEWGVPHREDASNEEALTPRNALRLHVLPQLEALYPGCTRRMAQTARLLQRDEDALQEKALLLYQENRLCTRGGLHALSLPALQAAKPAVAIRALRSWYAHGVKRAGFAPEEMSLSAEDSDNLLALALAQSPRSPVLNLPLGLQAYAGGTALHLQKQNGQPILSCQAQPVSLESLCASEPDAQTFLPLPGWESCDNSPSMGLSAVFAAPEAKPASAMEAYLPQAIAQRCILRTPRPDDTIHPLGAPGSKPLRRYLTDRKIPLPFRQHLPVLADGGNILWIPGLCTGQQLAYRPAVPCLCLRLTQPPPYLPPTTCKGDDHHG